MPKIRNILRRYGERGIALNKRKNGWFLKTYVLLTVAAITFFTVYAFRYDVLDFLYKKGYVEFETKESMEKKLKPVIEEKFMAKKRKFMYMRQDMIISRKHSITGKQ